MYASEPVLLMTTFCNCVWLIGLTFKIARYLRSNTGFK